MTDSPYLTVEQAGEYLHLHPCTVRELVRDGEIRGSKPANRWLFTRGDLDAFVNASANRKRAPR